MLKIGGRLVVLHHPVVECPADLVVATSRMLRVTADIAIVVVTAAGIATGNHCTSETADQPRIIRRSLSHLMEVRCLLILHLVVFREISAHLPVVAEHCKAALRGTLGLAPG